MNIKVFLDEGGKMPTKAHETDAGYDIYSPTNFYIKPRGSRVIDTKVHMMIPNGYVGMIKSKSGLNVKEGISSEGVIDSGFSNSITAKLYNNSDETRYFYEGQKITQIVLLPIPDVELILVDTVEELGTSERQNNGIGSSGKF